MPNPITPQVTMQSSWMSQELLRLDVKLDTIPSDFFGASFHLEGSGSSWSLDHYEVSEMLRGQDPLVAVKYQNGTSPKIIAGISLKRGNHTSIKPGKLLTFYIHTDAKVTPDFSFSHGVLSTFDQGRQDLPGVSWVGYKPDSFSAISSKEKNNSVIIKKNVASEGTQDISFNGEETYLSSAVQKLEAVFNINLKANFGQNVDPAENSIIAFIFIGFFVFIGIIIWRLRLRRISTVASGASRSETPSAITKDPVIIPNN